MTPPQEHSTRFSSLFPSSGVGLLCSLGVLQRPRREGCAGAQRPFCSSLATGEGQAEAACHCLPKGPRTSGLPANRTRGCSASIAPAGCGLRSEEESGYNVGCYLKIIFANTVFCLLLSVVSQRCLFVSICLQSQMRSICLSESPPP